MKAKENIIKVDSIMRPRKERKEDKVGPFAGNTNKKAQWKDKREHEGMKAEE